MADLKYCPECKMSRECTKKGFNKDGEQLYICKNCGRKFTLITGPTAAKKAAKAPVAKTPVKKAPAVKAPVKKAPAVKAPVKAVAPKTSTDIIVNNNSIKTVPGFISLDQAFDMVSSYFKEIAKEKAEIRESGDKKTIKFKVTAGGKN